MRQIRDALCDIAEVAVLHFVEHQREKDGERQTDEELHAGDNEGVLDEHAALIVIEEPFEIFEARPWASEDPRVELVFFECQYDAGHRNVGKYYKKYEARQQHEVEVLVQ